MGGSTQHSTSTGTSAPWTEQQPYLLKGMQAAQDLWQKPGPSYFPGSTVAPMSADQTSAQGAIRDAQTGAGAAGLTAATNSNTDFATGKYLNSNPYDDSVFKSIQAKVLPSVASSAMMQGRGGSAQAGGLAASEMTNAYAPYASQQYQADLGRMQGAIAQAPGLNQAGYFGANELNSSGQQQQQQAQAETTDQVNRFNFNQNLDYNKLQDYIRNIGGNWGSSTTSTTPYQTPSIWSQGLGAAMALFGG